jgi:hypothetical protein
LGRNWVVHEHWLKDKKKMNFSQFCQRFGGAFLVRTDYSQVSLASASLSQFWEFLYLFSKYAQVNNDLKLVFMQRVVWKRSVLSEIQAGHCYSRLAVGVFKFLSKSNLAIIKNHSSFLQLVEFWRRWIVLYKKIILCEIKCSSLLNKQTLSCVHLSTNLTNIVRVVKP